MQGSVGFRLKTLRLAVCAGLVMALALVSADDALAGGDKGFVVTLASQEMGQIKEVAHEPGGGRIYIATDRQIFRLSADRERFEHIAGVAQGGDPREFDPGVHPLDAALTPNSIAVHPVTKQLYIADSGSNRILRLSQDGQRLELVAGTGDPRPNHNGFLSGDAASANFAPSSLAFHPETHELYFINARRQIFRLISSEAWQGAFPSQWTYRIVAGSDGPNEAGVLEARRLNGYGRLGFLTFKPKTNELYFYLGEDGELGRICNLANGFETTGEDVALSRGRPFKFEPDGNGFYWWEQFEEGVHVLNRNFKDKWTTYSNVAVVDTLNKPLCKGFKESSLFDPVTKGIYITQPNGSGTSIHRVSRDGRRLDVVAGDNDRDEPDFSAFAEKWVSADGAQVDLLEVDPTTGNLLFVEAPLSGRGVVQVKAFVAPDEFGTQLRRKMKAAEAMLERGEEAKAQFEQAFSGLHLLAAPPENVLHCVNRNGKANKLTLPPGCNVAGEDSVPTGPTSVITKALSGDPHQRFRQLRAKVVVEMLSEVAAGKDTKGLEPLVGDRVRFFAEVRRIADEHEANGHSLRAHFFRVAATKFTLVRHTIIQERLRSLGLSEGLVKKIVGFLGGHSKVFGAGEIGSLVTSIREKDPLLGPLANQYLVEVGRRGERQAAPIFKLFLQEYLFAHMRIEEAGFNVIRTPASIREQAEKVRLNGGPQADQQVAWLKRVATAVEALLQLSPIHICSVEQLTTYVESYNHIWNTTPRTMEDPKGSAAVEGQPETSSSTTKASGKRERADAPDDNPAADQRHRAEADEPGEAMDESDGEQDEPDAELPG